MISSLRRNLQREYVERLIDLSMPETWGNASRKAISNLALAQLRKLSSQLGGVMQDKGSKLDAYSQAHLSEAKLRIDKALDASYIYNMSTAANNPMYIYMQDAKPAAAESSANP